MSARPPYRVSTALAVVFAALLSWVPASAQPRYITHRAKPGDSLQLLAAEYYGDRRHAVFIMVANKIAHPRPLKRRERIRIPVGRDITTAAGDSFKSLAAAHMGDERRAGFLAAFNGSTEDASIAAGEEIRIPLRVTHTAAARVDIGVLAATYLGDRSKASFLKDYNFLTKDYLTKGESIIIPILRVRVRQSKLPAPDEESAARISKRREMQELAARALLLAQAAWRSGDYTSIRKELSAIDTDYVDADAATKIGLLLGSTYIAFSDTPSALAAFRKVLERRPDHELDEYEHSPKIRAVWKQAGGKVSKSAR
jgi:hypothetical protein